LPPPLRLAAGQPPAAPRRARHAARSAGVRVGGCAPRKHRGAAGVGHHRSGGGRGAAAVADSVDCLRCVGGRGALGAGAPVRRRRRRQRPRRRPSRACRRRRRAPPHRRPPAVEAAQPLPPPKVTRMTCTRSPIRDACEYGEGVDGAGCRAARARRPNAPAVGKGSALRCRGQPRGKDLHAGAFTSRCPCPATPPYCLWPTDIITTGVDFGRGWATRFIDVRGMGPFSFNTGDYSVGSDSAGDPSPAAPAAPSSRRRVAARVGRPSPPRARIRRERDVVVFPALDSRGRFPPHGGGGWRRRRGCLFAVRRRAGGDGG